MALPAIFGRLLAVWPKSASAAPASAAPASVGLGGGPAAKELALKMQGQAQTNWCWAAVATSVSDFYRKKKGDQCKLVAKVLGLTPEGFCCENGDSSDCNQQSYLHKALAAAGCFVRLDGGAAKFAMVQQEINEEQPLGVRVEWTKGVALGGGHFIAISGWKIAVEGSSYLTVQDPWGPATEILPITELVSNYGTDAGKWTHSYFTAPPELVGHLGGSVAAIPDGAALLGGG